VPVGSQETCPLPEHPALAQVASSLNRAGAWGQMLDHEYRVIYMTDCASGGRALASKGLLERLEPEDAAALGLDPSSVTYTPLGELTTTTEKARRDAPMIPVSDV
jgi:hypothetical protein